MEPEALDAAPGTVWADAPDAAPHTGGFDAPGAYTDPGALLAEREQRDRTAPRGETGWLFRRAAQAVWQDARISAPAAPDRPDAPHRPAPGGLSLEELDRAVRRDSRRYDGELSIY